MIAVESSIDKKLNNAWRTLKEADLQQHIATTELKAWETHDPNAITVSRKGTIPLAAAFGAFGGTAIGILFSVLFKSPIEGIPLMTTVGAMGEALAVRSLLRGRYKRQETPSQIAIRIHELYYNSDTCQSEREFLMGRREDPHPQHIVQFGSKNVQLGFENY